jgi:hypothetical protein
MLLLYELAIYDEVVMRSKMPQAGHTSFDDNNNNKNYVVVMKKCSNLVT